MTKPFRPVLIALCCCVAISLAALCVFKLVSSDYEERPSDAHLKSEFYRVHDAMGGGVEHVNKPLLSAVSATIPLVGKNRDVLSARFIRTAEMHGWRSANQSAVQSKFCKDRLALSLEVIDDPVSPRMEYGVFWAADKGSFLYCGS